MTEDFKLGDMKPKQHSVSGKEVVRVFLENKSGERMSIGN